MYVVVVIATKGGVGKSTISVNLASVAAQRGMRVLLNDCDLQKSSADWRDVRQADDIVASVTTTPTIHKDLPKYKESFDIAIVDCGGETISPILASAMGSANDNGIIIIPVLPSVYDIWATSDTIKVLRQVRGIQDVEARFLMNQVIPNRIMGKEILKELDKYKDEVEVLTNKLYFRESFKKTIAEGKGVVESDDAKTKREMNAVFDEILEILKSKEK